MKVSVFDPYAIPQCFTPAIARIAPAGSSSRLIANCAARFT